MSYSISNPTTNTIPSKKGKLWLAFQVPGGYEIFNKDLVHCGNIIESKDYDGWKILGFLSSPYKTFSEAARRTLSSDLRLMVEYHPFVSKCPSCKRNHLYGEN